MFPRKARSRPSAGPRPPAPVTAEAAPQHLALVEEELAGRNPVFKVNPPLRSGHHSYTMFHSFKWAGLMLANMAMAPLGGLLALLATGTHMSVSSGVGFLALFGVCVQTGVIMLEYINQLRARGHSVEQAAIQGAVLRLRPIMMTTLVATLGLLPAALSHAIGSDSQRPFAIVIVGGLMVAMVMNVFLLPTLYVWVARPNDRLPEPDLTEEV